MDGNLDALAPSPAAAKHWRGDTSLWPGLLLTGIIAAAAMGLRRIPGLGALSPLILSIGLGALLHNLAGTPRSVKAGVAFAMRRVLRLAIILLGLQLTAQQVVEVGSAGIAIIAASLVSTFLFTTWLGRSLGVDPKLTQLIAAGTSICGASAIIATNTVTRAPDEDVAYAVACVTVFGSVAMFTYPLLPSLLQLDPRAFGLWSGASIHEIAQVVAASFQYGSKAGDFATITKLSRVMMLAPTVLLLGFLARRGARRHSAGHAPVPLPGFVLGFVGLVGANSVFALPAPVRDLAPPVTSYLLSMALAAMGLETDLRKLAAKGVKPFVVGLASFVFIALCSLLLIKLAG